MSQLRISIDKPHPSLDLDLLESLLSITNKLAPGRLTSVYCNHAASEIIASVDMLSEAQISDFVLGILHLSKTTTRSFTIATTLDDAAKQVQIKRYPHLSLGNEHIVHVRPTEGPVIHAYFQCMFGAA